MKFTEHGINRKVVNNDLFRLYVQYERNYLACCRNNENPNFSKIVCEKKEIFILKPSGPILALIAVNVHVQ